MQFAKAFERIDSTCTNEILHLCALRFFMYTWYMRSQERLKIHEKVFFAWIKLIGSDSAIGQTGFPFSTPYLQEFHPKPVHSFRIS